MKVVLQTLLGGLCSNIRWVSVEARGAGRSTAVHRGGGSGRGRPALVLATAWPDYKRLPAAELVSAMRGKLIIDPDRFLSDWETLPDVRYVTIGRPR